jgi:hypothetical protein
MPNLRGAKMELLSEIMRRKLLPLPTRRVLGMVGRCVYCDRVPGPLEEKLSDEHIIAFGLGGRDERWTGT